MSPQAFQQLLCDVQDGKVKPLEATAKLLGHMDAPITVVANQMTYLGRGDSTLKEVTKHLEPSLLPEFDPFQL